MLRSILTFAAAAFLSTAAAETIVADNLGNSVGLPLAGGNATAYITNYNTMVSTSPYDLRVYVNNGQDSGLGGPMSSVIGTREHFWFHPPSGPNGLYGNATLVYSSYASNFQTNNGVAANPVGQYLGTPYQPINNTGVYLFRFTIPVLSYISVNLTYVNTGAPQPVWDVISIYITNPAVVVGDPQFVGLRGQSFQVHGIDGAIYNIVTEKNTQVNSRFVFLSEGECPIIDGVADSNCWSHPGSYLGEMSFQQIVNGKLHKLLVVSGPAKTGFDSITLNDKELSVGDSFMDGPFSVVVSSTHRVTINTESFTFQLGNSDMFINQAVTPRVPLSKLTSHGLLGQTHAAKVYPTAARYIEGEVDDYVIADSNIFGQDFAYNKFQL